MLSLEKGALLCGRFTLLERIGTGGHGEVWRATDANRGEEIALKVLYPEVARAPHAWEMLRHEYAVAQRLGHPGIVEIGEPVRDEVATVLPMTLATGDLRRLRGEPYTRIVPALLEIAAALDHAHSRGVVHRDLKPSNVLIDVEGHINVADFGVASLDQQLVGGSPGSPFSASPQQIEGEPPAPADDIYGLGALAYELLGGYPPFYPNFEPRAIIGEPPAELQPIHPAPPRLVRLIMRMLSKDPSDRPASMRDLQEELHAALQDTVSVGDEAAAGAAAADAAADDERVFIGREATARLRAESATAGGVDARDDLLIAPGALAGAGQDPDGAPQAGSGASAWRWLGGGVLVAALVAVFLFLPRLAGGPEAPPAAPGSEASPEAARPSAAQGGPGTAGTAQAPTVAERAKQFGELHTQFDGKLAELEVRGAAVWGGPTFAGAKSLGVSALEALNDGQLDVALDRVKVAIRRLERVAAQSGAVAVAQVEAGERALGLGQTLVARQAFELALKIDPQNARARTGLGRTGGLASVLPTLAAADTALAGGDVPRALALYAEVLKSDPSNADARAGAARARAADADARYARAVGAAIEALRAGRLPEARAAIESARGLRPQAPEIASLTAQLGSLTSGQDVGAVRARALQLEGQERWAEALAEYDRLLRGDPGLQFASAGRLRVAPRAELAGRLQGLIDKPERLAAAEVRAEADVLLAQGRAVASPGPVLRTQIARLEALLPFWDKPVAVALESDGLTAVAILKVGNLGSFDRKEVELKPGRYTVVGTRSAYRDVRREISVAPGQAPQTIQIRCVDPSL
jgi:tetratricopeptide (TPR) repeat protein